MLSTRLIIPWHRISSTPYRPRCKKVSSSGVPTVWKLNGVADKGLFKTYDTHVDDKMSLFLPYCPKFFTHSVLPLELTLWVLLTMWGFHTHCWRKLTLPYLAEVQQIPTSPNCPNIEQTCLNLLKHLTNAPHVQPFIIHDVACTLKRKDKPFLMQR